MKKRNRKGFTIVELVIVIAVIGILAAVLIPTFSNVINDAKETAALQDVRAAYTQYLADTYEDNETPKTKIYVVHSNGKIVKVDNGSASVVGSAPTETGYEQMYIDNGSLTDQAPTPSQPG